MASSPEARAITDVYRRRLASIRTFAEQTTARAWQAVDPEAIDESLPPVLAGVEAALTAAQTEAARSAGLYLSTFLTAETGDVVDVPVDTTRYAGRTRDGRPVSDVLALGGVAMKLARSAGQNPAAVSLAGLARTVRAVRTEAVDAGRAAQADAMDSHERVSGYYRATSAEPCGACLALAGRRFSTGDVFPIHGACACTAEPIVRGVPDRYAPPTGSDLFAAMSDGQADRLYGPAAEAIRTGAADVGDMVETRTAYRWGAMLFEAPVSKVAG